MDRYRYVDKRVDKSIVALGIDKEAKHCLCKDGDAGRDTALYRNYLGKNNTQAESPATPLRTMGINGLAYREEDDNLPDINGETPKNADSLFDEDGIVDDRAESDIAVI